MKYLVLLCLFLIIAEFAAFACDCSHCPTGGVCVGPSGTSRKFCVCIDDKILGKRGVGKMASHKKHHKNRVHFRKNLRMKKMRKSKILHKKNRKH